MKEYTNKKELTDTIKSSYKKYRDEFENIPDREVCKFIHINTVAPFGTFRAKIRKWKKLALQNN